MEEVEDEAASAGERGGPVVVGDEGIGCGDEGAASAAEVVDAGEVSAPVDAAAGSSCRRVVSLGSFRTSSSASSSE